MQIKIKFYIERGETRMKYFYPVPKNLEILRKLYKKLCFEHHPDVGGSEEAMKTISPAIQHRQRRSVQSRRNCPRQKYRVQIWKSTAIISRRYGFRYKKCNNIRKYYHCTIRAKSSRRGINSYSAACHCTPFIFCPLKFHTIHYSHG